MCKRGYTGDGVTCTAIQQEPTADPCGKISSVRVTTFVALCLHLKHT